MSCRCFQRLQWLIEIISDFQPITLKEIQSKWDTASLNYDAKPYARRTFIDHVNEIEQTLGICIKCNNHHEYYIDRKESSLTTDWIIDSFSINNTLNNAKEIEKRIILEDVPSGRVWLIRIMQAMKNNYCLKITHQSFKKDYATTRTMRPYFIQSHHRRWYLYAVNKEDGKMLTLAFDRITDITILNQTFKFPKNYDPENYLAKGYGASIYEEIKPERIHVKATAYEANFMRTLPMHESQKEIETTNEYSIFEFYVPPVNEFIYDILHRGESVEIVSPPHVRKKLTEIVNNLAKLYKKP